MTREEVIKILQRTKHSYDTMPKALRKIMAKYPPNADECSQALDLAIESLSVDEEKENGTFVNRDNCNFNCNDSNRTLVDVVRCKDCRHYEDGMIGTCWKTDRGVSEDFFCAYGERGAKE